jgi:hypothetical protein
MGLECFYRVYSIYLQMNSEYTMIKIVLIVARSTIVKMNECGETCQSGFCA